jgi:D-lactate dehydratase
MSSRLKRDLPAQPTDQAFCSPIYRHAALYDFPTASSLQKIASDVYSRGGIFATVCHGAAILPGVLDKGTGESIAKGKTVTGFTREAEYTME